MFTKLRSLITVIMDWPEHRSKVDLIAHPARAYLELLATCFILIVSILIYLITEPMSDESGVNVIWFIGAAILFVGIWLLKLSVTEYNSFRSTTVRKITVSSDVLADLIRDLADHDHDFSTGMLAWKGVFFDPNKERVEIVRKPLDEYEIDTTVHGRNQ